MQHQLLHALLLGLEIRVFEYQPRILSKEIISTKCMNAEVVPADCQNRRTDAIDRCQLHLLYCTLQRFKASALLCIRSSFSGL